MGRNGRLLAIEKSSHCLSYYDLATGERTASIALPDYPHELVVDSEQRFAYISHYGVQTSTDPGPGAAAVLVVDIAAASHVRTIDCRPFMRVHGIALDERGRLLALSETANVLMCFENPQTAVTADAAVPSGGLKSHLLALTRDGSRAFCMNLLTHTVTRVAPHDATVPPVAVSPGLKPEGNCLSSDETTLYVSNRISATITAIDVDSMQVTNRGPARRDPARLYPVGEGQLLVAHYEGRCLTLVDTKTLREVKHVAMPGRPAAARVNPDGDHALVSLDTNEIIEVDLAQFAMSGRIATQLEPDCLVFLL